MDMWFASSWTRGGVPRLDHGRQIGSIAVAADEVGAGELTRSVQVTQAAAHTAQVDRAARSERGAHGAERDAHEGRVTVIRLPREIAGREQRT
jgi:hypothetical protein